MKKRTIAAAVLLAALTSCQNEVLEVPELEEGFVIKAKVENYATDTKSSVTDEGVFSWIKGDAIGVYNGTNFLSYYAQEAAASASFSGEASTSLQKVAVSPAALSPVVADGALNKITLPSEYEWVKDQTNIPMVAEFENISEGLTFKYLGGLFKVQLKGVPATATKFVFTADKDITGEYTIVTDDDSNKIIKTAGSESNKSVTFTFSLTEAQDMDFYIPVPVGEYKTVTIGVYQSDGTPIITKTGTNTHNIARKGLRIINAITISNIDAGGEDGEKDITVASSHEGTYYLPSTTATLNVYMEENVHAVSLVYTDENADCPATVNIICKGNIGDATAGTGLTVNLPKSHVNVKGEVDGTNVIILQALTSSTSASTLVLENTVKIADKLTVAKGSATIGCEVKNVKVEETAGENAAITVAEGATVTETLEVAQAGSIEIAGTVPTVTVAATATAPVVTVASTAKIETKLEVANAESVKVEGTVASVSVDKASSVEVAGTVDAVAVKTEVSSVTIASAVKTVEVTAASTTTETAPVIWVTGTGKVTEAVKDATTTSSGESSKVTIVAANGQTTDTEVGDGQIKVVKGSDDQAIENAVKTPADYLKDKIENGGEITLEDNISGNFTVADGKTVVINLNGKTVSNGESSDAATFTVALGGKLTINGEGTVDNKINRCAAIHNNGTLVLNGGTYTRSAEGSGNSYYTILNHGDMTINSGVKVENEGTFSSTVASGYDTWKADAVSKYAFDSNTNHQNPTLTINGGTITGGKYNVKHNGNDGTLTVAEGVELDKAKINDTIVAYVASETALNAALADTNIAKIILTKDIALENIATINNGRKVVIDMNSHSVSKDKTPFDIYNATVEFTGTGIIAESKDDQFAALRLRGAETDCADYTVVTIGENITLKGWSGIAVSYDAGGEESFNNYGLKVNFNGKVARASGFTADAYGIYLNGLNKQTTGNVPEFNLEGADISVKAAGIYAAGYAKWNITNSVITGADETAIEIRAGELTVESGTYTSNAEEFSAVKNGNGTTITGAALAVSQHTTNLPIKVTLNGGTFKGVYALYENDLEGDKSGENVSVTKEASVIFNGKVYSQYNSELNTPEEVSDADAFAAALADANVKTITLGANIAGDFSVASGRTVTVNLNGKTITNSKDDTFTVALGGSLTIEGKGTVDNITHGKACIYNNGTVALNGGTYTRSKENGSSKTESGGNSYYNILNHGTMTIAEGVTVSQSGGFSSMIANGYYKYTSTDPRSGYVSGTNAEEPSLTISGGSFEGGLNTIKNDDGANLKINGGTFVNTKQACIQNNNYATINDGTFNPTGAVAVQSRYFVGGVNAGVTYINDGTFNGSLVSYGGGTFVFGDNFTGATVYVDDEKSLNAALANTRDSTIALNNDIALVEALRANRKLTLDLNGKTISPADDWKNWDSSTKTGSDALIIVNRKGDLTITGNGSIDANGNQNIYAAVKLTEAGESAEGDTAKLTIENGTFKGYYYAISGNGTRHDTDLTINGGTFNGNTAIYHPQEGKFTVSGGNFEAVKAAIELRAGTLNISGGTFTATASEFSKAANGNGTTVVGAALAISQHVTDLDIKVNVTGGTFKGVYALYEDDLQNATGNVSVSVSDATLNGMVYSKHNTSLNKDNTAE